MDGADHGPLQTLRGLTSTGSVSSKPRSRSIPSGLSPNHQSYHRRHPDKRFVAYIYRSLWDGLRVGFSQSSAPLCSIVTNHPLSNDNPGTVTEYLREELHLGRLVGLLPPTTVSHVHTSPIGLVPKSQSNKWHIIVDLSSPRGWSVNNGISPSFFLSSINTSVDNAVEIIRHLESWLRSTCPMLTGCYRCIQTTSHCWAFHGTAVHLLTAPCHLVIPAAVATFLLYLPDWGSPSRMEQFVRLLPSHLPPRQVVVNRTGVRRYRSFCIQYGLPGVPLTEQVLCRPLWI